MSFACLADTILIIFVYMFEIKILLEINKL